MASSAAHRGMYKRGDVYYSRITGPDGKLIRKKLSADKQTATLMLAEMRKTVELQKVGILPDNVGEKIRDSLRLKELYLDRMRSLGRTAATVQAFTLSWLYFVERNKLTRIDQITVARAQEFADKLREKGVKGQTINHYVGFVKDALDWAHGFEYITRNPLARWESVKNDAPRKRRDLTPEEIERFFAAEDDAEFRLRWMVYFRTGLRATAGMNVAWEWMRWDEQAMVLPAKANKSGVDHWLPLDVVLFTALREKHDSLPAGTATGRIFPEIELYRLRKRFQKVCEKAGIDLDGLCLHSIRHTYATLSFEASGYNLKVVQELLCHSNGAMTMRYIHASQQQKREANDAFGSRMPGFGADSVAEAAAEAERAAGSVTGVI